MAERGDITQLLHEWKAGKPEALQQLIPLVYPDLKRIASGYLRREQPGHTLQATGLVHELYLRLCHQREANWEDRSHFYTFAAKVMRRILTDHARASHAGKRGAGLPHLPLSDEIPWINLNGEDVLDLNRALDELESLDPRKVRLVELRYYLGCTLPESAALLSISTATAERDLTLARTWLYSKLAVTKASVRPAEPV